MCLIFVLDKHLIFRHFAAYQPITIKSFSISCLGVRLLKQKGFLSTSYKSRPNAMESVYVSCQSYWSTIHEATIAYHI